MLGTRYCELVRDRCDRWLNRWMETTTHFVAILFCSNRALGAVLGGLGFRCRRYFFLEALHHELVFNATILGEELVLL